jgi:hypothetical protein
VKKDVNPDPIYYRHRTGYKDYTHKINSFKALHVHSKPPLKPLLDAVFTLLLAFSDYEYKPKRAVTDVSRTRYSVRMFFPLAAIKRLHLRGYT